MRAIFTGSRDWPADDVTFVHAIIDGLLVAGMSHASVGDCKTGIDRIIRIKLRPILDDRLREFEANWDRFGRAAGPIRNQRMVDGGGDLCVAFSNGPIENSVGTRDCASRAEMAKIPVFLVEREGLL